MKVHKHRNTAPLGSKFIDRGTEFGNPYVVGLHGDLDAVCDKFEELVMKSPEFIAKIKHELKGKDLVCSCKRHGDFLLKIANGRCIENI